MNRELTTTELERIRNADDATLFAQMTELMQQVARDIVLLAAIVHELSRRQSDIAERAADVCKSGFWVYLPLVASGQVSALAVATFCMRDTLLPLIAQLPIAEQERLSQPGATFDVEFRNPRYGQQGQPEFDTRKYPVNILADTVIPQVFDSKARAIRDKAAQRAFIAANAKPFKVTKEKVPTIEIDHTRMALVIDKKHTVSIVSIANAVAQLIESHPEVGKMFRDALRKKVRA